MVGGDNCYHQKCESYFDAKQNLWLRKHENQQHYLSKASVFLQELDSCSSRAIVNQQPPMHQLAVLSMGWAAFFHPVSISQPFFGF